MQYLGAVLGAGFSADLKFDDGRVTHQDLSRPVIVDHSEATTSTEEIVALAADHLSIRLARLGLKFLSLALDPFLKIIITIDSPSGLCYDSSVAGTKESSGRRADREVLRAKLEAGGYSLTSQRAAVYDYVAGVDYHPTAEAVFLAVKRRLPKIGLATVYKNLETLVECRAISRLTYGDGSARYDIRTDHHYHTRCLACGSVADLDAEAGDEYLRRIRPPKGFEVKDYRLELIGYCGKCQP